VAEPGYSKSHSPLEKQPSLMPGFYCDCAQDRQESMSRFITISHGVFLIVPTDCRRFRIMFRIIEYAAGSADLGDPVSRLLALR